MPSPFMRLFGTIFPPPGVVVGLFPVPTRLRRICDMLQREDYKGATLPVG